MPVEQPSRRAPSLARACAGAESTTQKKRARGARPLQVSLPCFLRLRLVRRSLSLSLSLSHTHTHQPSRSQRVGGRELRAVASRDPKEPCAQSAQFRPNTGPQYQNAQPLERAPAAVTDDCQWPWLTTSAATRQARAQAGDDSMRRDLRPQLQPLQEMTVKALFSCLARPLSLLPCASFRHDPCKLTLSTVP